MDSVNSVPTLEGIADLVIARLTASGKLADLQNASLLTIEEETIEHVDLVTRAVMSELLVRQADQAEPPKACPRCGGQMATKKPQGRSLQSRRGKVNFKTEVFHCEACRLDFFPSAENIAV